MPRRPRPPSRLPPQKEATSTTSSKKNSEKYIAKKRRGPELDFDEVTSDGSESDEESSVDPKDILNDDSATSSEEMIGAEDEDDDVDVPRVVRWVDEDELEEVDEESEEEEALSDGNASGGPPVLKSLQSDLSSLPLGALRRAQRALAQANVASDSDTDANSGSESDSEELDRPSLKGKEKEKPEWSTKPRLDIAKRSNKHAPMEITSKRPVTRRRTVVEVKALQPRDPRFLPIAGEFSALKFQEQYSFLADAHKTELKTLRENLKQARKLLASSPRDLLAEREQEVNRLGLAVKRVESLVNRDRREKVERAALTTVTKEERDKRKQGKGGWWMKESDKKDLLVRARYDALAATGGKRAVKKAIEKKQKKIGQKEKKSRPFSRNGSGGGDGRPPKRFVGPDSQGEGGRFDKRRRVEK